MARARGPRKIQITAATLAIRKHGDAADLEAAVAARALGGCRYGGVASNCE